MKKDVRIKEEGFEGGWDGWLMSWSELKPLGYTYMILIQETEWKKGRVRQHSLFKYKLIQLLLPRQEELEMSWGIYVYVPAWVFFFDCVHTHVCDEQALAGHTLGTENKDLEWEWVGVGRGLCATAVRKKRKNEFQHPSLCYPLQSRSRAGGQRETTISLGHSVASVPSDSGKSSLCPVHRPMSKGKDLFFLSGFMTFQSPSMLCSKCKSF